MGFAIRRAELADADAIAHVHVETWQAAYAGIVDAAHLAALDVATRTAQWRERLSSSSPGHVCFVAVSTEHGVVGFAAAGPTRGDDPADGGELYALYVSPHQHGRGAGRALVEAAFAELDRAGLFPAIAWVLAENHHARGFYEHLGGRRVREADLTIGHRTYREIALRWNGLGDVSRG